MLRMTATQQADVTLEPRNARGGLAPVDAVPVWASSDPNVCTVEPSANGLTAIVKAVNGGVAVVTVVADADLDVGETRELTGVLDVVIAVAEAVIIELTAGTPIEQPIV